MRRPKKFSLLITNIIIGVMMARHGSRFELFSSFCFDKKKQSYQNRIGNVTIEEVVGQTREGFRVYIKQREPWSHIHKLDS